MMRQPGRIKSVEILREQGSKSGELLMHHDETVAMLREVAAGKRTATLRIYQPNPTVAFGRRDELNPGFTAAAQACRDLGYDILVRKVGGHAAAYHTGCLVI
ncbi:MAG: lipoate--protein ligase family protein, partial [Rothia dentocariosa]